MTILETERLTLREFTTDDAEFILRLLNEPSFLQNIGDRGVRDAEQAVAYLTGGPMQSYADHGHGLWRVARRDAPDEPIGMCGLLRREQFDDADLGYAFLPEHWSRGYAVEAATGVLDYGRRVLGMTRVIALVQPTNAGSIRVLEKLGFRFSRHVQMKPGAPETVVYELPAL